MPNSPEQITAFEKQISSSIDFQIDQLSALNEEKSRVLKNLKSNILDLIQKDRNDNPETPEREEKYSADLRLTEKELESIFEELKKSNSQLFAENEIGYFYEFKSFIGLDSEEITFAYSLQEVTLFGKKVELFLPLGTNKQVIENYGAAIKQIETKADLEAFITPNTKLIPRGGMRLEFIIQKDGKEIKYSATPERILRVDTEPPSEKIKEWTNITLEIRNLERQFREDVRQDKTLTDEQKMMIEMRYRKGSGMGEMSHDKKDEFKIPQKYQTVLDRIEELRKQEYALANLCSERQLFDESKKQLVREKGDPRFTANFEYEYLAEDRSIETRISHVSNTKSSVTEYFPKSDRTKTATSFYDNGGVNQISEFQANGEIVLWSNYRKNGTINTKRIGQNEDVYDENGENVVYRRLLSKDSRQITNVMVGRNGENFATLDFLQQITPDLSDNQYLDYLAKNLDTPQKLAIFFELFMRYVYDDPAKAGPDHDPAHGSGADYWQLAEETIHRIKEGKMLGDCDDYAFLAKEILRKQGKIAYVEGIPSHAICIWFEKRPDGRWDGYSLCTFGLDKNGNRYGMPPDPKKEKGYQTLEEALNSLMTKYDGTGIGVDRTINYRIQNGKVEILHIPEKGKTVWTSGIPVDLLPNQQVVDRLVTAQGLTKNGEYGKAISGYETLLKIDPSHNALYHQGLASALEESSKKNGDAEAKRMLLEYIEKYPDRPEYHVSLGRLLEDNTRAQEQFSLAIKLGCTDALPYIRIADFYSSQRDNKKRIEVLELAVKQCPNIYYYYHSDLARAYIDSGDREKAIQTWEEIIRRNPNESYPKIELAKLYHRTDPKKAKEMYEQYIVENPKNPSYHEAFGDFYANMLIQEILDHADQYPDVVQDGHINHHMITPDFLKKNPVLAEIHQRQIEQYEKALDNETSDNIFTKLIDIYDQLNQKDDVFRLYKQAIDKGSTEIKHYLWMSNFHKNQGQIDEQIKTLELALVKVPPDSLNSVAYLDLAEAYLAIGNKEKAIQTYESALDKDDRAVEPLAYLYYSHEHNLEKAKQVFFRNEPQGVSENQYQARLSKFYGLIIERIFKENPTQFDKKYRTNKDYNPIKVSPAFLKQYPEIALMHSEKTKALAQVCQSQNPRLDDFKQLATLYNEQGKEDLALTTLQTAIEKFKDKYDQRMLLSYTISLLLVQGNIAKAVNIFSENKKVFLGQGIYRIELDASYMNASQKNIITFYEKLLKITDDSEIHSEYAYYLCDHALTEKLSKVFDDAIKKFPEKKEYFKRLFSSFVQTAPKTN